jgi:hypothetical protein
MTDVDPHSLQHPCVPGGPMWKQSRHWNCLIVNISNIKN